MMIKKSLFLLRSWFDSHCYDAARVESQPEHIPLTRILPFIGIHLACLLVFWVGVSPAAVIALLMTYALRVFSLTAFFHRYFAHRAFKTNRFWQFIFAFLATSSAQRGPLWWASHHREHHRMSDQPGDTHSPVQNSFAWSHTLWFLANKNFVTITERVQDWARYAELRWINRYDSVPPIVLAVSLFIIGQCCAHYAPQWHTNGWQMLVWGFFVSTVLVYHVTFCINSLAHRYGSRRYTTTDDSRNNWWLALLTFGEGWHNNHHHYPASVRQGFFWWEVDLTYYVLKALSLIGVVRDLKPVPAQALRPQ